MMSAPIIIMGARNTMRIIILNAFWTLFTSVVRRVTSDAVENLSTLENEKDCTFSNSARRTFLAKPMLATAPKREPSEPKHSDTSAISIMSKPIFTVYCTSPLLMPLSIIAAITSGISSSISTSPIITNGVAMAYFLYLPI